MRSTLGMEIAGGVGGLKQKCPSWVRGGYGCFLELHNVIK